MFKLTSKEKEVLYNFLSEMNYYEMMNILCRTYEEIELEEVRNILVGIIRRLGKLV
jgi:hypothetical protein